MINQFEEAMHKRSDLDLIKILNQDRNKYQAEAILAAEEELKIRNLSINQVNVFEKRIEIENKIAVKKANEPLDNGIKFLATAFPGLIQIAYSGIFIAEGYQRKAEELTRWTLYGYAFYFIIIILAILF